ncbi:MAG: helix-turn-helix transcriptional regulator [Rhizobiaceae bacterium]
MTPRERSQAAGELFKDRLKAARKQTGLTQDELVAKADISAVTLSKLETGVNRPAFEVFVALAYALETSPNVLVGWNDTSDLDTDANRRQLLMRLNTIANRLSDDWLEQLISISEKAVSGS